MYAYTRYASHHIYSYTEKPTFDGIQIGLTIISFPTGVWSTKVHASEDKQIPLLFFVLHRAYSYNYYIKQHKYWIECIS